MPLSWPLGNRDGECFLYRFLGERNVAEEARKHGHGTSVFAPEDCVNRRVQRCCSMNGRTSMGVVVACASFRAHIRRRIEVGYLHNGDTADLLLALYERPVGQYDVAVLVAQNRCRIWRMESATEHPYAGRLHFIAQRRHVLHDLGQNLGAGWLLPAG